MAQNDEISESFPAKDIVFDCRGCGKSLVINALGAGLTITCPECGAEQQVPLPDDEEAVGPAAKHQSPALAAEDPGAESELTEISEVLANARERVNALTSENDALQFRCRFLEKRQALAFQNLQAFQREVTAIRKAFDRIEATLKSMEDPSAHDTQPIA